MTDDVEWRTSLAYHTEDIVGFGNKHSSFACFSFEQNNTMEIANGATLAVYEDALSYVF